MANSNQPPRMSVMASSAITPVRVQPVGMAGRAASDQTIQGERKEDVRDKERKEGDQQQEEEEQSTASTELTLDRYLPPPELQTETERETISSLRQRFTALKTQTPIPGSATGTKPAIPAARNTGRSGLAALPSIPPPRVPVSSVLQGPPGLAGERKGNGNFPLPQVGAPQPRNGSAQDPAFQLVDPASDRPIVAVHRDTSPLEIVQSLHLSRLGRLLALFKVKVAARLFGVSVQREIRESLTDLNFMECLYFLVSGPRFQSDIKQAKIEVLLTLCMIAAVTWFFYNFVTGYILQFFCWTLADPNRSLQVEWGVGSGYCTKSGVFFDVRVDNREKPEQLQLTIYGTSTKCNITVYRNITISYTDVHGKRVHGYRPNSELTRRIQLDHISREMRTMPDAEAMKTYSCTVPKPRTDNAGTWWDTAKYGLGEVTSRITSPVYWLLGSSSKTADPVHGASSGRTVSKNKKKATQPRPRARSPADRHTFKKTTRRSSKSDSTPQARGQEKRRDNKNKREEDEEEEEEEDEEEEIPEEKDEDGEELDYVIDLDKRD